MSKNLKVTSHKVVVDKLNKCEFTGLYQIQAKLNILCDYDPNDTEISTLITELEVSLNEFANGMFAKYNDKDDAKTVNSSSLIRIMPEQRGRKKNELKSEEELDHKVIDNEPYVSLAYIARKTGVDVTSLSAHVRRPIAGVRLQAAKIKAKYWVAESDFQRFQKLYEKKKKLKKNKQEAA